jgi:hypothetical protein
MQQKQPRVVPNAREEPTSLHRSWTANNRFLGYTMRQGRQRSVRNQVLRSRRWAGVPEVRVWYRSRRESKRPGCSIVSLGGIRHQKTARCHRQVAKALRPVTPLCRQSVCPAPDQTMQRTQAPSPKMQRTHVELQSVTQVFAPEVPGRIPSVGTSR